MIGAILNILGTPNAIWVICILVVVFLFLLKVVFDLKEQVELLKRRDHERLTTDLMATHVRDEIRNNNVLMLKAVSAALEPYGSTMRTDVMRKLINGQVRMQRKEARNVIVNGKVAEAGSESEGSDSDSDREEQDNQRSRQRGRSRSPSPLHSRSPRRFTRSSRSRSRSRSVSRSPSPPPRRENPPAFA